MATLSMSRVRKFAPTPKCHGKVTPNSAFLQRDHLEARRKAALVSDSSPMVTFYATAGSSRTLSFGHMKACNSSAYL